MVSWSGLLSENENIELDEREGAREEFARTSEVFSRSSIAHCSAAARLDEAKHK